MDTSMGITATTQTSSVKTTANNKLNEDDFMLLLLAQLKTQDPLEPMNNQELMGQMTQLNSLASLKSIDESMKSMSFDQQVNYGATLIGKDVTWKTDEGSESGEVTDIIVENNKVYVQIGEKQVSIKDVIGIAGSANINITA